MDVSNLSSGCTTSRTLSTSQTRIVLSTELVMKTLWPRSCISCISRMRPACAWNVLKVMSDTWFSCICVGCVNPLYHS